MSRHTIDRPDTWRDSFRKKLSGHEAPAPEMPWHDILPAQEVAKTEPGLGTTDRGHRYNFIPGLATALAAIMIVAGTGVFLMRSGRNTDGVKGLVASISPEQSQPEYKQPEQRQEGSNAEIFEGVAEVDAVSANQMPGGEAFHSTATDNAGAEPTMSGAGRNVPEVTGSVPDNETDNSGSTESVPGATGNEPGAENAVTGAENAESGTSPAHKNEAGNSSPRVNPFAEPGRNADRKHWSAKTYIAGAAAGSHTEYPYGHVASLAPVYGSSQELPEAVGNYIPVVSLEHDTPASTNARHFQPLRLGIRFSRTLGTHWSIETGIQYSLLHSEFSNDYSSSEQNLNYIGIPIAVSYHFAGVGNTSFYASAGATAEKMVYGKNDSERVHIKAPLFSVNAAVGAEYRLGGHAFIFAEPSIGYYFNNGSEARSYYNDRSVVFGFSLGARFAFR